MKIHASANAQRMQYAQTTKTRLTIVPVLTKHALHVKFLRVLLPNSMTTNKDPNQIVNAQRLMEKTHATQCTEDNSPQDSMEQLAHHRQAAKVEKEKEGKVVTVKKLALLTLLPLDLLF